MTNSRTLKISESGDFWRGRVIPFLRIAGKWFAQAGFRAGTRVEIENPQPGVLIIRQL